MHLHHIAPPLCLLLALAMLIAGFAVWSVEPPQAGMELHQARVEGDQQYQEALEGRLAGRQSARRWLLWSLFGGSLVMVCAAFLAMRES